MKKTLRSISLFLLIFIYSCTNNYECTTVYITFKDYEISLGNKHKSFSFKFLDYFEAIECAKRNNNDIIFLFSDEGSSYRLWRMNIPDTSVFFKEAYNCMFVYLPLDIKNKLLKKDFLIIKNDTIKDSSRKNQYIFRKYYKGGVSDVVIKTDKNGNFIKVLLTPEDW
jgi:hypothetical protein